MIILRSRLNCVVVRCAFVASVVLTLWISPVQADVGDPLRKLTAMDREGGDYFGISTAIDGTTAVIGAFGDNDDAGSAYLFNVSTGGQLHKLTATDGVDDDEFGTSVGISGSTAIVGSPYNNDTGSAYLFNVSTGGQLHKLTAADGSSYDSFGYSVAVSGNTAIVGSPYNGGNGAAYLFDATTGSAGLKLTADDGASGDSFGYSVAIDGNIAIVGAYCDNDWTGAAYLYNVTTGDKIAKLTADDGAMSDMFGISVAISGNVAIVGALGYGSDCCGAAYLYDATNGEQLRKLTASDPEMYDDFGVSVAIHGNTAVVGAYGGDDGGSCAGSAYLFDVTTGDQLAKLLAGDAEASDDLGVSVAIDDNYALVGADGDKYGTDSGSGAAYVFEAPAPEPATLGLLIVGGLALLKRYRG